MRFTEAVLETYIYDVKNGSWRVTRLPPPPYQSPLTSPPSPPMHIFQAARAPVQPKNHPTTFALSVAPSPGAPPLRSPHALSIKVKLASQNRG